MNILEACDDPHLFKPWFKNPATWGEWRALLCALFGLPMTPDQFETFRQCAGRPGRRLSRQAKYGESLGRRGGKSFTFALVAVFLTCSKDYRPYFHPGERGTVIVIAADRRQARTIMRYVSDTLARLQFAIAPAEWQHPLPDAEIVAVEFSSLPPVTTKVHHGHYRAEAAAMTAFGESCRRCGPAGSSESDPKRNCLTAA